MWKLRIHYYIIFIAVFSIKISVIFANNLSTSRIPLSLLQTPNLPIVVKKIKNLPMFLGETYRTRNGPELTEKLILTYLGLTKSLYSSLDKLDKNSSYQKAIKEQDFLHLWEVFANQESGNKKESLSILVEKLLQKKFINSQFLNLIKDFDLITKFINNGKKQSKIPIGSSNFFISGIISSLSLESSEKKKLFKNSQSDDIFLMLKKVPLDKEKFDKEFRYSDFSLNQKISYKELLLIAEEGRIVDQKIAALSILSFLYSEEAIKITNNNVKVVQEVFPKNFNIFLQRNLLNKKDKLLVKHVNKMVNDYGQPSLIKKDLKMALLQVPAFLSTYRGCVGGDCSTKTAWAISYNPYEYIFYILNKERKAVGYMSVDLVKVNNDLVLYVKDITGSHLSEKHVDWALHSLFINKDLFQAKYLTVANPNWFNDSNHFYIVKKAMSKYNQQSNTVNQKFFITFLQKNILKKQKHSNSSEDTFSEHEKGIVFVPDQKIIDAFTVKAKENPFLNFSFFKYTRMKKEQWKSISIDDAINFLNGKLESNKDNLLFSNKEANQKFLSFFESKEKGIFNFSVENIINKLINPREGTTVNNIVEILKKYSYHSSVINAIQWSKLFDLIDTHIQKGGDLNSLAEYVLSRPEAIAHPKWASWVESYIQKGEDLYSLAEYVLSKPETIAHSKWASWIESYIQKGEDLGFLARLLSKPETIAHSKWASLVESYIQKGLNLGFLVKSVLSKLEAIAHPKWASLVESYIQKGEDLYSLAEYVLSKPETIAHSKWASWVESYIQKGEDLGFLARLLSKPETIAHSKWASLVESYIQKGEGLVFLARLLSKPETIAHPKWASLVESYIQKGEDLYSLKKSVLSKPEAIAHPNFYKLLLLFVNNGGSVTTLSVEVQDKLKQITKSEKLLSCKRLFK